MYPYNANTGRAGMAQYLMGLGPMPLPTPQEIALGLANRDLNSGAYENPMVAQPGAGPLPVVGGKSSARMWSCWKALMSWVGPETQDEGHRLAVKIPVNSATRSLGEEIITCTIKYDLNVPREDFLSQVCATIGIERQGAHLAWKSADDKKKGAWQRMETHHDVSQAFEMFEKLLNSTRRQKPVIMEVTDLVCYFASVWTSRQQN